jgi:hypothetical protein
MKTREELALRHFSMFFVARLRWNALSSTRWEDDSGLPLISARSAVALASSSGEADHPAHYPA